MSNLVHNSVSLLRVAQISSEPAESEQVTGHPPYALWFTKLDLFSGTWLG